MLAELKGPAKLLWSSGFHNLYMLLIIPFLAGKETQFKLA